MCKNKQTNNLKRNRNESKMKKQTNKPLTLNSLKMICNCDNPVLMHPASKRRAINASFETIAIKSGVNADSPSEPAQSTNTKYDTSFVCDDCCCVTFATNVTCPREDSGFFPVGAK